MRRREKLTALAPTMPVNLPWDCVAVMVSNPTGSPVYLRVGGTDIPTQNNTDLVIPAASVTTYGAVGRWFGLALADPTLVTTGATAVSGLEQIATIEFLSAGEVIPQLGSISFQTLSLSDLTRGPVSFAGVTTTGAFDLNAWGGALLYVLPTVASGQGVLTVQASSDQLAWTNVLRVAFWPDVPLTVSVPRVQRFVRLVFNATAIPGEPSIAGAYSMRASLEEITETVWAAGSGQVTKSYNVPNLSTSTYYFCTVGLKSVSVRLANSAGSRAQLVWYTSNVVGNWSQVAYREQSVVGFYNSVFRSLGNLDSFLRIDVVEIANAGPLTGTLNLSIQAEPDTTGMLQNIFAALGDIGQPVNANQSIYHVLDTMRLLDVTRNASLVTINNSILTGNSSLSSINALTNTVANNTSNILSTLQAERTDHRLAVSPLNASILTAGAGVWATAGGAILTSYANGYIYSLSVQYGTTIGSGVWTPGECNIAIGTNVGPNIVIWSGYGPNHQSTVDMPTRQWVTSAPIVIRYDGTIVGGFFVNPAYPYLWAISGNATAVRFIVQIGVRIP